MKKNYEKPEMKLDVFSLRDVITVSETESLRSEEPADIVNDIFF